MITIPLIEPAEIIAGDTLTWKKSLSDYPAPTYTLKYRLINAANKYDITAAASGDDHLVTVTAATSAGYAAGIYTWTSWVEKTGERYTISNGTTLIKPNLAAQSAGYDTRSHIKKTLDSIEAAVEGRATRTDLRHMINGREVWHMSPEELIKWHSHYKQLYQQELQAEKIKNGLGTGRKILTRFR